MASQPIPKPRSEGCAIPVESKTLERTAREQKLLPVLRPKLPSCAEILPYLEDIDRRNWYSNCGPLVTRLEQELSRHNGLLGAGVITTSNATAGITATLLALQAPAGSHCLMPSWTFAATPHAARAAGLTPWFHDVDRSTWALDPGEVMKTLARTSLKAGAVIVVSPFGAPINTKAWEAFEDSTGIRVMIDAAAGFDTAAAGRIPSVVSLHATKILGAGEGGFIATTDRELLERVRACCNFGFHGSRSALLPALNAKMSEYHAAVALANLGKWKETRAQHMRIVGWYRQTAGRLAGFQLQPGYGSWATSATNIVLPQGQSERIAKHLLRCNVETRAWWGQGCHVQPAFENCPRGPLPETEDLGARVLGLPHFPDMRECDVAAVAYALDGALRKRAVWDRRVA